MKYGHARQKLIDGQVQRDRDERLNTLHFLFVYGQNEITKTTTTQRDYKPVAF